MKDYKKDAKTWTFNVEITNRVPVRIKTNNWQFAQIWLRKQLTPLKERLPEDATFELVLIECSDKNDDKHDTEIYGKIKKDEYGPTSDIEIFEQVKDDLFKE